MLFTSQSANNLVVSALYYHDMVKGALDAIYWQLHSAYLTNNRESAKRWLAILENEIGLQPEAVLSDEIGEPHLERFKKIRSRMARGEFGRLYGEGGEVPAAPMPAVPADDKDELDFCRELAKERKALCKAIGCGQDANIVRELEMGQYGRCDFVIVEARVAKILEVKMGEANHSLVSQIDKYRIAMELDMNLGGYDAVEAYVLAGSYPQYVLAELGRAAVVVLSHDGTPNNIRRIV